MRARAPASAANLGPGFDTLALGLAMYVEVDIRDADALSIVAEGDGAELPRDETHLAARVASAVTGHDRHAIHVHSDIPVARGLGSSAALALATAAAAGANDPLAVAARLDGHPENAGASFTGGFVTATTVDGAPVVSPLALDDALEFVLLIPDRPLSTDKARAALPQSVDHHDAAFNLGRMGLLIAGLADHRRLVREAMEDRLHQHARQSLFPQAQALIDGLVAAGALGACWSGAGPSILAVCELGLAASVRAAGDALLRENGVDGRALQVGADRGGLTVG